MIQDHTLLSLSTHQTGMWGGESVVESGARLRDSKATRGAVQSRFHLDIPSSAILHLYSLRFFLIDVLKHLSFHPTDGNLYGDGVEERRMGPL